MMSSGSSATATIDDGAREYWLELELELELERSLSAAKNPMLKSVENNYLFILLYILAVYFPTS